MFFRRENIIILKARSILCALRYGKSEYPLRRLLIRSDNLSLVLALCKERSKQFTLLSVMRRIFASGLQLGFVLSFWWIPSELNYSDKGGRFFDRDFDPSKSLLAQRLPRSPHAPTKNVFLLHRCSWMMVKLIINLVSLCPR